LDVVKSPAIIGTFPSNVVYATKAEARSVPVGEWDSQGSFGDSNQWVTILELTASNSVSLVYTTEVYGSILIPHFNIHCTVSNPSQPYYTGGQRGNITETRISTVYGSYLSGWYISGLVQTNTVFGTNAHFLYCTNKYW